MNGQKALFGLYASASVNSKSLQVFVTVVEFEEVESALRNPGLIMWDTITDGMHVAVIVLSKVDILPPPTFQLFQAHVSSPEAACAKDTRT